VLFRATPTIIGKINSIVHNAEDRHLSDALKHMEISVDAPRSAAETPKNNIAALAKKIAELMKKLNGKGKVSETISPFIVCSASLLSVSHSTLADFCSVFIVAVVKEADKGEEQEFFKYEEQEKADPPTVPEEDQHRHQICKEEAKQEVETWSEKGFWEEEWQEIGLTCDRLDLFLRLSCTNVSHFHNECTSCASHSFLLTFLPFSSVVNVSLCSHIQVCIYFFQVHVLSSCQLNIFDYNTYPLIVTYMPHEIALFLLTFSAPDWLLGSRVYTKAVHTNMNISIPSEVTAPLSVGLKYLWPIGISTQKVKSAWEELRLKVTRQWTYQTKTKPVYKHDYDNSRIFEIINRNPFMELDLHPDVHKAVQILQEEEQPSDKFFRLPVPYIMQPADPSKVPEVLWIEEAFDLGWGMINCVLSSSPIDNKDSRPRAIDLNEALHWLESNKILVKPTDKNLGTALVSLEWYDFVTLFTIIKVIKLLILLSLRYT